MNRNTAYATIKSRIVEACIRHRVLTCNIPLDIVERTLVVLVNKYKKSHEQIADEFQLHVRWVRILHSEAVSLSKLNNEEHSVYWEDVARGVAAGGIEKYADLNVPLVTLARWIRMVRGREQEVEEDGRARKLPRFDRDLYLAAALAQGQPEAWAFWHEQFELPLIRWLMRLPGAVRLGEELVAELAGDLFGGLLKQYKGESALRTWLTVIVRNRLTDRLRQEGRSGASLSLWEEGEPAGIERADISDELCDRMDGEIQLSRVIEELKRLPAHERVLVKQHFFKGTSMRVLGVHHGVNRTQIGRRIKHICTKLRSEIGEDGLEVKKLRSG